MLAARSAPVRAAGARRSSVASCRPSRAAVVVRASQAQPSASRRQVAGAAAAALLAGALGAPRPAFALFGIGGNPEAAQQEYAKDTGKVLELVTTAINLDKDAPDRDDRIAEVRTGINTWVAKYRRNESFSGRPSYSNTYAVCNALAGHYNSFGTKAPIPKKRLERLVKELNDAQLLLERGR